MKNRRISRKAILHSITILLLTTHALHLTGFFWLQWKSWELLSCLHLLPFLTCLCNERLKLAIHWVQLWRNITHNIVQALGIKVIAVLTACLFLQSLHACRITSARALSKTAFGHFKSKENLIKGRVVKINKKVGLNYIEGLCTYM